MKISVLAVAMTLGAAALGAGCSFGPDAYNGPYLDPAPPDAGSDAAPSGGSTGDDGSAPDAAAGDTAAGGSPN